jgi:hypothetical protein
MRVARMAVIVTVTVFLTVRKQRTHPPHSTQQAGAAQPATALIGQFDTSQPRI